MSFRMGTLADLEQVCALYEKTVRSMEAQGLGQWHWGEYPNRGLLRGDLEKGQLTLAEEDGALLAAFVVNQDTDREYENVDWLFGVKPAAMHRLAVSPEAQGRGLGRRCMAEVEKRALSLGCDSLRLDTYTPNDRARSLYTGQGFRRAGEVYFEGRALPFVCYEKMLVASCPLLPLRMEPAFRGGALTPWGGQKLRRNFGKPIPSDTTGESLEVSCIPGLESRDMTGVSLPELIRTYGERFAGRFASQPFPLLLKLLDAREPLSVQVHPNNAYAAANEGGKLGKTEAWLILQAEEGSELIYGVVPGTTKEELQAASENGARVEHLLRRVKVRPGDVCFIPAGCVHAICGGILLYEIQQSSDVTYRFYDWDRTDAQGRKRELHLKKALDVADLDFTLEPIHAPDGPCSRVLDTTYFTLDLLSSLGQVTLPAIHDFGFLTALDAMELTWEGGEKALGKGETLFLPASCPRLQLCGMGRAALSMPGSCRG